MTNQRSTVRPLFLQIATLIDRFLCDEVDIAAIDRWLATHPGAVRPQLCDEAEQAALRELLELSQRPINDHQWAALRDRLRNPALTPPGGC